MPGAATRKGFSDGSGAGEVTAMAPTAGGAVAPAVSPLEEGTAARRASKEIRGRGGAIRDGADDACALPVCASDGCPVDHQGAPEGVLVQPSPRMETPPLHRHRHRHPTQV